jgi:uncharacterized protein
MKTLLGISLHQLEEGEVRLEGSFSAEELALESLDELVTVEGRLDYALEIQLHGDLLHVRGRVELPLACTCVRCLEPFTHFLRLDPWTVLLPLRGEEGLQIFGDWVDLTPVLRDDVLLAFPQHPLCKPECSGLLSPKSDEASEPPADPSGRDVSSQWAALDQLNW